MDPSGYRTSAAHRDENDAMLGGESQMSDEERFKVKSELNIQYFETWIILLELRILLAVCIGGLHGTSRTPCLWLSTKDYFINVVVGTSLHRRATLFDNSMEVDCNPKTVVFIL